jgi:formylglycine-generating enzyme required for sulfatase activity
MADDLRHFLAESPSAKSAAAGQRSIETDAARSLAGPTTGSQREPIMVVPKGLRSFDAGDAEFFLELMPGPRDRDGLPDSIRFWKSRIETTDADASFAVGLIYGPSGCGKSSLVKAGLLPRLAKSVTAVYVEATAEETEARLLKSLRRHVSDLPSDLGLIESLAALRQGRYLEPGQQVLLVLDQFEQWLHAKRDEENTELVQALRQCDGGRLRCIVMVRDDFWLAVSRFMKSMEIEILEGRNSALVDLFDPIHARKVLAAFGRAYGRLPENLGQGLKEENAFLDQAIASLTREGKIISVRLALFAEMFKSKPWTPASLKEVGGAEGVGITFLEETFSATTASPEHRYHQQAARAVLRSFLPESGADIKGQKRSHQELLEASGYAGRRKEFSDLMRILDSELRLVTPTDLEGQADSTPSAAHVDAQYYQLSHDYLVPSLRGWLTRKQKESHRGRAELRLAEAAAWWNAKRERRRLPTWWEWANIRLFTRAKNWTEPQRTMMSQVRRRLTIRGALVAAGLAVLLAVGWEAFGRMRAQALMDDLVRAPTADVPAIVRDMKSYRRWLNNPLNKMYADAEAQGDARKQLHLSLAMLPADSSQVEYLLGRLLTGSPQEVAAIRSSLAPRADAIRQRLWNILEDERADPNQRLRAACFLAADEPRDGRWNKVSGDVAARLVAENALLLKEWADELRPVAGAILPALAELVGESRGPNDQRTLAGLYAEFASSVPDGFKPLETVLTENPGDSKQPHATLARRQATAAAALAAAKRWDSAWPLLGEAPNPTRRSYLIAQLGIGGAAPRAIIERLNSDEEPDAAIRQAMILVLGDFGDDLLSASQREKFLPRLRGIYRGDPHPGVHAAAGWLLRRWGRHDMANAVDRDLATGSVQEPRQWYVTRQGQSMAVVSPGAIEGADQSGQMRTVRVDRLYSLATHELTVAEFLRFRDSHQVDQRSAVTDDSPVNEVTWYDATAYCNWLSNEEGVSEDEWCYLPNENGEYAPGMKVKANASSLSGYRLPTEAEWEYACRAGTVTPWSAGEAEDLLDRYAWYLSNAGMRSRPVGQLRPNDFGLFDLHGNAWEWCQDRWDDEGAQATNESDDEVVQDRSYRALRGGTFLNDPLGVSSATRNGNPPSHHTGADGFRVARTLP